ncbi:MAG TPA: hypothetical protein VHY34_08910 [Caulobacteraceae bacterium]|jgi:hypothetical protein|nr:hypothetical protein [Caulobacteraceae bacterium]
MARNAKPPLRKRRVLQYDEPTLAELAALGAIQCTRIEAAMAMGVPDNDLNRFFECKPLARIEFEKAAAKARADLRTAQFELSKTSPVMAVFLGKHYLGQADRRELDQSDQIQAAGAAERVRLKLAAFIAHREAEDASEDRGGV